MPKRLIVIEGLDGSGKATQTRRLAERLRALGRTVRVLEFPDYESPASAPVRMYLGGEFGDAPRDVNAYAASAFYAVDRAAVFLKLKKAGEGDCDIMLCDRYATSNIIYQMSKLGREQWDGFIKWQEDFEYGRLEIPKPDTVIYLDVEPEISQRLMLARYGGDDKKKDLHEKNFAFLVECRKSALYAAKKCGWRVISCCENGEIKDIEKISAEIEKALGTV